MTCISKIYPILPEARKHFKKYTKFVLTNEAIELYNEEHMWFEIAGIVHLVIGSIEKMVFHFLYMEGIEHIYSKLGFYDKQCKEMYKSQDYLEFVDG